MAHQERLSDAIPIRATKYYDVILKSTLEEFFFKLQLFQYHFRAFALCLGLLLHT